MNKMPATPDLPPEMLRIIFQQQRNRSTLHNICLTNRTFYALACPLLYRHMIIETYPQRQSPKAGLLDTSPPIGYDSNPEETLRWERCLRNLFDQRNICLNHLHSLHVALSNDSLGFTTEIILQITPSMGGDSLQVLR